MSLRQQSVPAAAFEIRFSTVDSELEILEIQTDNNSHERNVPDPFKKRDKIPRSSGSIEQFTISNNNNNNSNGNNSNSNNGNINIPAAVRHSSLDSQVSPLVLKSRHHVNGDNLNNPSKKVLSTSPDQISSLKVKSSNAVGPEAVNGFKNSNVDVNALDDDLISRNAQYKKQRSSKIDEISSEKEGKVISNHQIMDLNGKAEPVVSNNKIIKNSLKNKKINMSTNNYKEDESMSLATPPATPPFSSHSVTSLSENEMINLEEPQLVTPPSSSSARSSGESISRVTQQVPRSSKKRRGSQSSQLSFEIQPAAKLQAPRSRKISSTERPERPRSVVDQPQTTQFPIKSKETQTSQQSQPIPIRSRIPRLSISSRERPVIAKKESDGSISLSSQDFNRFDDPQESLSSSYPVTFKSQPPRGIRPTASRPIINTSFMTDTEVESESQTSYSPSSYSSTGYSPTNHSPTTMSQSLPKRSPISHSLPNRSLTGPPVYQKKLISHDDVIIPTIAKKLKMNGQLHFVNHDALLGYSEEPEDISPTSENGYMDITDQVVDLFDGSGSKSHKSQLPVHGSQRRLQQSARKNSSTGHSRNSSKTHYIAPRKQNYKPSAQQTSEDSSYPTTTQSPIRSTFVDDDFNKQRKSRREEYIMVIQDDDDDDDDNTESSEPSSSAPLDPSVPSVPSEPIIAPTEQVESNDQIDQEKIEEPVPVQVMPIMQETLNPAEVTTIPTTTSGKIKKGKKKQKKGSSEKYKGDGDPEEENVRRSICRCM